jgi:replicative DNA helicase Mcm
MTIDIIIENEDFFEDKVFNQKLGEKDILRDEFNNFIKSQSNNVKIMILCYKRPQTIDWISSTMGNVSLNVLKNTISRLKRDIKLKNITQKNNIKCFVLHNNGLKDLIKVVGDFIRQSEYILSNREDENITDSKKYIKLVHEFLESEKKDEINKITSSDDIRHIEVSISELAMFDPELSDKVLEEPIELISMFEESINYQTRKYDFFEKISIRFRDLPKSDNIEINSRRKKHMNKLVQLTGLIKRKTRPQIRIKALRYLCTNPACNYSEDIIKVPQFEQKIHILESCPKCKGMVERLDPVESDTQLLMLEEDVSTMETTKANVDSIKCVLQDDLTDIKKDLINDIGTKVSIVGILRTESKISKGGAETVDKTYYIEVNNIINDSKLNEIVLTKSDIEEIQEFGKKENSFDELKQNFLPEIMGYPTIKETLLLQLFGGRSINGSRAESHILLLGDPGVAKSQMTKLQAKYSKKSMYSSGSGSSKAGLTGAVIKDEMTGDFVLEAGAMSKANGGIMAVDEMDKMSDDDTGIMHEALEHGEITINKANINATVSCKCSVLASANPKFGKFDDDTPITKQINFPPALLSRFDLIFILKDRSDKKRDGMIADHILSSFTEEIKETKYDIDFYKKYIHYCKENFNPTMDKDTAKYLQEEYVSRRDKFDLGKSKIPLGARQLNGWIRFSFALAKANFTDVVTLEHAKRAIEIFESCWEKLGEENLENIENSNTRNNPRDGELYKEIIKITKKKKEVKIKDLEKMFSKDISQLKKVIEILKKEGKIYEPKKGIIKEFGGSR